MFALIQAAAPAVQEPILIGLALGGVGGFCVWMARTILDVRDKVIKIGISIYGDPESKLAAGLLHDIATIRADIERTDRR